MTRVIFSVFVFVLLAASAFAQTPGQPSGQSSCTLSESPAIRGLKLGMNTEQVLALFPGSSQSQEFKNRIANAQGYPNYGFALIGFSGRQNADMFAGIDNISVELFDDRVVHLAVNYAGPNSYPRGANWSNLDGFIAKLSEAFRLPNASAWLQTSATSKALKCGEIEIVASNDTNAGAISLRSTTNYSDIAKARRAADEEKLRRTFKP
jgi:hypothetical protein